MGLFDNLYATKSATKVTSTSNKTQWGNFDNLFSTPTPTRKVAEKPKATSKPKTIVIEKPQQTIFSKSKPIIGKVLDFAKETAKNTAIDLKNVFAAPFKDIPSYIKARLDPKASKELDAINKSKLSMEEKIVRGNKILEKYGKSKPEETESARRGAELGASFFAATGNISLGAVEGNLKYIFKQATGKLTGKGETITKIVGKESNPQEVINTVFQSGIEKTADGKGLVKTALQAKQQGKNIVVEEAEEKVVKTVVTQSDQKLINQYRKNNKGKFLNTDDVREVYTPEGYNRINSADFQERATKLTGKIFDEDITTLKPGDNYLFTAGVSGGGKSTALKQYPHITNGFKAGYDGNFSSSESIKKLERVIATGAKPKIVFTYRDPLDAWNDGVIRRVVDPDNGRVVPMEIFLDNLVTSRIKVLEAYKKFGDKVEIQAIDNSKGKGKAVLVDNPIDFIEKISYNIDDVTKQVLKSTRKQIKSGKISKEAGEALLGRKFSKQPQSQRPGKQVSETKSTTKQAGTTSRSRQASQDIAGKSKQGNETKVSPKESVKPKEVKVPPPKQAQSRVFERLQKENPEQLQGELPYDKAVLKTEFDKAAVRITKDKQNAYEVAMGRKGTSEIESVTTNIEMAEKALADGNNALYEKLTRSRSIAQTRRGQAIVAEKGSVEDNSVAKYVKELYSARLDNLGKRYLSGLKEGSTIKKRAVEIVDGKVEALQVRIQRGKLDAKTALKLLDELACV